MSKQQKADLRLQISVTEHLIDTYSELDPERLPELEVKLKALEYKLLDVMVAENAEWLEMFKEQNAV